MLALPPSLKKLLSKRTNADRRCGRSHYHMASSTLESCGKAAKYIIEDGQMVIADDPPLYHLFSAMEDYNCVYQVSCDFRGF